MNDENIFTKIYQANRYEDSRNINASAMSDNIFLENMKITNL